jgi:hypothetical protein
MDRAGGGASQSAKGGNPTEHSGIAAVLRPGEYHRVAPA